MASVSVFAPAKINLSLDVVGKKENGYHLLSTVMQSIGLGDRLTIGHEPSGQGIQIRADQEGIPLDGRNTAWRAADGFAKAAGLSGRILIDIRKSIPTEAGLAGGSADAAAVLFALDRLNPGCLSPQTLFDIAVGVGADVPFCLQGGTVLCEGIGEVLTPLAAWEGLDILLIKPPFGMSTPWVFNRFNLNYQGKRPNRKTVLAAVADQDIDQLAAGTANVLESVSLAAHPELAASLQLLKAQGASLAMMSGSGPTVFGLFKHAADCSRAKTAVRAALDSSYQVYRTRTVSTGPAFLSL